VMNMIIEIEKSSKSFKSSENQSSDNIDKQQHYELSIVNY
jgi:hypothetical protein